MSLDRPFLTFEEQILKLKEKDLIVEDDEYAMKLLKKVPYYSLINGFKDFYIDKNSKEEKFITGTHLHHLEMLYRFDTKLQHIIFKYIMIIEKEYKTLLSYTIAKYNGVKSPTTCRIILPYNKNELKKHQKRICKEDTYLDFKLYRNSFKTQTNHILDGIAQYIFYKKDNPCRYYLYNHNHIPPWIIMQNLTLGETTKWFQCLKSNHKIEVILNIIKINITNLNENDLIGIFLSMIEIIREFRNQIAHGHRFYLYNSEATLPIKSLINFVNFNIIDTIEYKNNIGKNDLYAFFISIVSFLDKQDKKNFINELTYLFSYDPEFNISNETFTVSDKIIHTAKLPRNFLERLKNINFK